MASVLDCCFRTARWFPVVFIVAVIGWSYYAYVIELLVYTIPAENVAEKVILGLIYHPVLFMFMWSYYQIVYTSPRSPPLQFYLTESQLTPIKEADFNGDKEKSAELLEQHAQRLPILTRNVNQGVRICEICNILKPDRAHHCSVCKQCVLKMDHHCPWVNNCVCFNNYKYFILFLLYAELYCLYVVASDIKYFIRFWAGLSGKMDLNFHILFLLIVAAMFAISVAGLLGYHIYLVLRNQSTLESFRPTIFHNAGPDKHAWNLTKAANWREVFGDNKLKWFLPVYTAKGDGVRYTTRSDFRGQGYSAFENGHSRLYTTGGAYIQ